MIKLIQISILLIFGITQVKVHAVSNSKSNAVFAPQYNKAHIFINLDENKTRYSYGYNDNWDIEKEADALLNKMKLKNAWGIEIHLTSKVYNETQEIKSELIRSSMNEVIPLLKSDSIVSLQIYLKECSGIYSKLIMDELNTETYENILELTFDIQIHSDVHFNSFSSFPNAFGIYIYLNDRTFKEEVIYLNSSYFNELDSIEEVTIYAIKSIVSILENQEESILQNTSVRIQNESTIIVKNKSIKNLRITSKEIDSGFLKLISDFENIERLEIETIKIPNLKLVSIDEVFFLYTYYKHPGYDLEEAINLLPSTIIKLNIWSFNTDYFPIDLSRFNQIKSLYICNPFVYENLKEIKNLKTLKHIKLYPRTEFLGQKEQYRIYFNNDYIQRVGQYFHKLEIGNDSFDYVLNKQSHKTLKQLGRAIAIIKPDTIELPIEYLFGFRHKDIKTIKKFCDLKIINNSLIDSKENEKIWNWYQREFNINSKSSEYLRSILNPSN